MHIAQVLNRVEEIVASVCLGLMVAIIGMQVFNRYVLGSSLVWSEELGRYLFIWAVYIGAAYATKEDRHLSVTFAQTLAPPWLRKPLSIAADLVTLVFCGFCVVWGVRMLLFLNRTGQETPAMEIAMYWVYLALPVGMLLMAVRVAQHAWRLLSGDEPDTTAPTSANN